MTLSSTQETLIRAAHESTAIDFGVMAAFCMEDVEIKRIGFADIPVVSIAITSPADPASLVAVARQVVFRELSSAGVANAVLQFRPTVATSSKRSRFVDTNSSSPSLGKNKMGHRMEFHFEVADISAFIWSGSRGRLKNKGE